jgi:hypothetical protein
MLLAAESAANRFEDSDSWVGNWGRCEGCQGLERIEGAGRCEPCLDELYEQIQAEIQRKKEAGTFEAEVNTMAYAILRPKAVQVGVGSDQVACWGVTGVRRLTRLVAEACANVVTRWLEAGRSLDYCLSTAPLGRDLIARELAAMGCTMDRKTVAAALAELVESGAMERSGQLEDWVDPSAEGTKADPVHKSGSFTYRLKVIFRQIGDLAAHALAPHTSNAAYGGMAPKRRIEGCRKWASRHAKAGERNHIGHWLARRCRDCGLSLTEAQAVVQEYRDSVPQPRSRPAYTLREAMATLRSVYRRHS